MDALPASAPSMTSSPITEVCFVLPPDLILLDLAGAADAFRIAAAMGLPVRLRLMAPVVAGEAAPTALGVGLAGVEPLPATLAEHVLIVVCGATGSAARLLSSAAGKALVAWLRRHVVAGRPLACVCSGALLAAAAGLLDGRRCTTHHSLLDELRQLAPAAEVLDSRVFVEDGEVCTSAGITAGIDLALAMIAEDLGEAVARATAQQLVVYHRRPGGQSQFSALLELERGGRFDGVLTWARENLHEPLTVEQLAEKAAMSPRHFARAFTAEKAVTPAKAVERLRVEAARALLDSQPLRVEDVAIEAGFGDPERMRRAFMRAFGQPPQAFRRAARA